MFTISDEARFLKRMLVSNINCYECTQDPIDCKFYDQVFDQSIKCTKEECVEHILMMERCKYKRTAEEWMDNRLGSTIACQMYNHHGRWISRSRMFDL